MSATAGTLRPWAVFLALVATVIALTGGQAMAQSSERDLGVREAELWTPFLFWRLSYVDAPGNPFDVEADVVFAHPASGERHESQLFYAGDDRWEFRFTGTRTGDWRFTTRSEHAALDGWHGIVEVAPNPDPLAGGFLTISDNRFAQRRGPDGRLDARLYNVYYDRTVASSVPAYPLDAEAREDLVEQVLDRVEVNGMDAAFLSLRHSALEFGAESYRDHDSENPDLASFEVVETVLLAAHQRGLGVHIWMWGDEERRQTAIGPGGINGPIDRRLQRYIAARLGPLPGWTMSYGFDLDEWVTPDEVREWWRYMRDHLGWPHPLMARETDTRAPRLLFDLGDAQLDVASYDDGPTEGFFETARSRLEGADEPVLFERRFLHTRDDVWDMDTTRRALWQFTLAGGAGAIWGVYFDEGPPYPEPEQLRTHARFWRDRFLFELDRSTRLPGTESGYALRDGNGRLAVFYAEGASTVPLELATMAGPLTAVAVDTREPYREIPLGTLDAADTVWTAPYVSDWAIAVGAF